MKKIKIHKRNRNRSIVLIVCLLSMMLGAFSGSNKDVQITSYTLDPGKQHLAFYSGNAKGEYYRNIGNFIREVRAEGKEVVFAMNGGMFDADFRPHGLYIEKGKLLRALDVKEKAYGNFYLQPNGVFYLTNNKKAFVCERKNYKQDASIQYATQSGPMLVIDGHIHPAFGKNSNNLHIRNGVGILPDGNILFGISDEPINLYEFAKFFQRHGCNNALYLDGYVSRMWLPQKSYHQMDGLTGIIIAEIN